jgi:hypothetical protein
MTDRILYAMMATDQIDGDSAQSHGVIQTDIGDTDAAASLFT